MANNLMQGTFLIVILLLMSLNFYLVSKSNQSHPVDVKTQVDILPKSGTAHKVDVVTDINVIPKVNVAPVDLVLKVEMVPAVQNPAPLSTLGNSVGQFNVRQPKSLDVYRVSSQKVNLKTNPNEILVLRKIVEGDVSFFSWQGNQALGEDNILKYLVDTSFEDEVRKLFNHVLKVDEPGIVLDIGANSGFYGLMGAAYGHQVLAFEPQPHCRLWISASVQMNGFNDQYLLFPKMVTNDKFSVEIDPRTGCWGTWPLDKSKPILPHNLTAETVSTVGVDEIMDQYFAENPKQTIWIMKIDVEGAEQKVLASAHKLLASKMVKNLLIEINGVRWEHMKVNHTGEIAEFDFLYDHGYEVKCTCFGSFLYQQPLTRQGYVDWLTNYIYSTDCWAHLKE